MSGSSRDFYHPSSGRPRGESQPPALPPIRDVVGDVLEQPARPMPGSYDVRRSTSRASTTIYTPSTQGRGQVTSREQQSLQLPPIQSTRSTDSAQSGSAAYYPSSSTRGYQEHSFSSPRQSSQDPRRQERPALRGTTPAHSFDVFVVSPSGQGLVHKRTSNKDDFHQVAKEDAISSSTGRHVCDKCGRRFEKLSTLKNHLTTHSGERPYECPECGRSFSVSSNMRRHMLTHTAGGSPSDNTRS